MSNTQPNLIAVNSTASLSGKEGYLVVIASASNVATAAVPAAITDNALCVVEDGAGAGEKSTLRPIFYSGSVRLKAKGSGAAGVRLVNADPATAADAGKVRAIPAASGTYAVLGVALEDFVDAQLVNVLPVHIGNVVIS